MNASGNVIVFFFGIHLDGDGCVGVVMMCSLLFLSDKENVHIFHTIQCNEHQQCPLFLPIRTWTTNIVNKVTRYLPKFSNDRWHLSVPVSVKNYAFTFLLLFALTTMTSRSSNEWCIWVLGLAACTMSIAARSHTCFNGDEEFEKCTDFSHLFLFVRLFTYFDLYVCPFDYICNASNEWEKSRQEATNGIPWAGVRLWECIRCQRCFLAHNSKAINIFRIRHSHSQAQLSRIYFSVVLMFIVTVHNHFLLSSHSVHVECVREPKALRSWHCTSALW